MAGVRGHMKLYFIEIFLLALIAFLAGALVSGWATSETLNHKYARCLFE